MNHYRYFKETGKLTAANQAFLEQMHLAYLENPQSVSSEWQAFFADQGVATANREEQHPVMVERLLAMQLTDTDVSVANSGLQEHFRRYGHLKAGGDQYAKSLEPRWSSLLSEAWPDPVSLHWNEQHQEVCLAEANQRLQEAYQGPIGYEFMHLESSEERQWWQQAIECDHQPLKTEAYEALLTDVMRAEQLERYLGRQFVGQKRFSLEGSEAFVAMLNQLLRDLASERVEETVIAMAHRGRLNVLVNVMGMPVEELLALFAKKEADSDCSGDVKYHLGRQTVRTDLGTEDMALTLCANPSHLEAVNAVAAGLTRQISDLQRLAATIVVHGDAAMAGQGCVMELLNMARTQAYHINGMLHVVINNQIGFTTDPWDDRSTRYCTDVAKGYQIPIMHVDADQPLACARAAQLAVAYRQRFAKDVFIDLQGFRKFGHNEADEPRATQPLFYAALRDHPGVSALFRQQLLDAGALSEERMDALAGSLVERLEAGHALVDSRPYIETVNQPVVTEALNYFDRALASFSIPSMQAQRQVAMTLKQRLEMAQGEKPLNWGFAELMAYATLLAEGKWVRLLGQDAQRGTFSHRHAVLHDQQTGERVCPLASHFGQEACHIYNSTLSENAALAFEYGYSLGNHHALTLWEAQFGDFVNGAQVIIDQFLVAAEQKWQDQSNLVLLLPHGYEGQGPEHSSARLERFLQLAAQDNCTVAAPTTPAQIYHLLRRQAYQIPARPLIIMSPKSFLRHPQAVSSLAELRQGAFSEVIADPQPEHIERVVLCSGKVYYDIRAALNERPANVWLLRLEQLYPLGKEALAAVLAQVAQAPVIWCQEEPENQGAWRNICHELQSLMGPCQSLRYVGRPARASVATGYLAQHMKEQAHLLQQALYD